MDRDALEYRGQLLKFLVALRDVGVETNHHIYDLIDPCNTKERKKQSVAIAIVSKDEILNENVSSLKDFIDHVHKTNDPSLIKTRVVHHGRVAVAKNAGETYSYEHGECRLLDPTRRLLFEMIDGELESKTGKKIKDRKQKEIVTFDKGGVGVLKAMEKSYKEMNRHEMSDAVLLLYSYFIPCSIDFHNCAKLIHKFAQHLSYGMAIGYERVYKFTDQLVSIKWLNTLENVTIFNDDEIKQAIRNQFTSLMSYLEHEDREDAGSDDKTDYFGDMYDDLIDVVNDQRTNKHLRQFRKGLCRRIEKNYKDYFDKVPT